MRVVLQRVTRAEVRVDGRVTGRIGRGFVVLAGFTHDDDEAVLTWCADKIMSLRLFPEQSEGGAAVSSFATDLDSVEGGLLVVSQFTLYGDARRGRRPGFTEAAPPEIAVPLYERFVALLRERAPGRVETGVFGAMMEVELVNDGPVTLVLDRSARA
jgi:D-tyrosyl-tRNA(Tyr) deacylase